MHRIAGGVHWNRGGGGDGEVRSGGPEVLHGGSKVWDEVETPRIVLSEAECYVIKEIRIV